MISDERLEEVINGDILFTDEQRQMAKELQAYRKEPIPDEFLNARQNDKGMFEISEDCMCRLINMLCRSPNA